MFKRRPDTPSAADAPEGLSSERLEQWCVGLREGVITARGVQGQLGQLIGCGELIGMPVIELVDGRSRRPGGALSWSQITRRCDASHGRLVILGDPGYGKTVAALTLVGDVNARDEPDAIVAELFSLTDWDRSQAQRPGVRVIDWLAEQLSSTYRELPLDASRRLIAEGLVLAVLEGLDEIATPQRRACVQAIDAYTRGTPRRPLVLTCRSAEYDELAPGGVDADRVVMLTALQREHVASILADRTATRPGWDRVRARHAAGDATLDELFANPLRLSLALRVYHDRDAGVLLDVSVAQARGRLWETLLGTTADTFDDATAAQNRDWLASSPPA
ncbi:MAG TPA: NACHT domain-containing protein [Solirubrobacteraceae bacterium]